MISKLLWLSAAGTAGTLARVWLSTRAQSIAPAHLPLGTAIVNVLGCFLFGVAFAWFDGRSSDVMAYRVVVLAGFMGAFTTFSSYLFETLRLIQGGRVGLALANLLVQNTLGFGSLYLGLGVGRSS